jgi:ribosomal protein L34E
MALLVDVSIHRIIRRSTAYGAPYDPNPASKQDDEVAYGLHLVSIGAKAMAKSEFLQQEWINNGNFVNLGEECDPNVDLQEGGATSRFPECRSGAASTASRLSTSSAVAVLLHALPVGSEMARGPPLARRRSYRNEGEMTNDTAVQEEQRAGTGKRCLDVGGKLRGMLEQEPVGMKRGPYRIRKSEESLGRRVDDCRADPELPCEPANILALRYFGPLDSGLGRAG